MKSNTNSRWDGCDFIISLGCERLNTSLRILQLTDMQIIDSSQRREPDRLRPDEITAWSPAHFDINCGNSIRSLVMQTKPDLIIITGDIIYGSFDDSGKALKWFVGLMDSFGIPWAPVFGNHDNESKMGVEWQCSAFESSKYGLFARGNVSGNGNYTIGITVADQLKFVLYMLDSHGCLDSAGVRADQLTWALEQSIHIQRIAGRTIPSLFAFHIPTTEFLLAEKTMGYAENGESLYTLGVDVPAKGGDFGCKLEPVLVPETEKNALGFMEVAKKCNARAVCVGHFHDVNTCITYEGIRFVYGLKTGQYDYHLPGQLGGTLLRISGEDVEVSHVPSLTQLAPYPRYAPMLRNFFTAESE